MQIRAYDVGICYMHSMDHLAFSLAYDRAMMAQTADLPNSNGTACSRWNMHSGALSALTLAHGEPTCQTGRNAKERLPDRDALCILALMMIHA